MIFAAVPLSSTQYHVRARTATHVSIYSVIVIVGPTLFLRQLQYIPSTDARAHGRRRPCMRVQLQTGLGTCVGSSALDLLYCHYYSCLLLIMVVVDSDVAGWGDWPGMEP